MKIVSGVLILITVFLSVKHGWAGISGNLKPEETKMLTTLGISQSMILPFSIITLVGGLLVLFPQTFLAGNIINAVMILLIMIFSLRAGDTRTALIEIPFLLMPLVLVYLGHPLKK